MGKGGQNDYYEKNGGAKAVRAIARLLGGCGGMLPQKIFEFYTPLRSFLVCFQTQFCIQFYLFKQEIRLT